MATYDEIVFDKVKRTFSLSEDHYYGFADFENFVQQLKFGLTTAFPYVVLKENNEYSLCDNQNGIDLKNEIRVHSDMLVDIVSLDVDEMIRLEDTTKSSFTTPQSLAIGGERCVSGAKVFIDTARQIVRCNGAAPNGAMYESDIPMKITDIILPKNVVNPIKVELDGNAQRGLMKHLSLLDDYALLLENKMSDILKAEYLHSYQSEQEKIPHLSFDAKLKYQYLSRMHDDVAQQIIEMYTFENICQEKITLSDHGFKMCYAIMLEDNCNIKAATQKYKERKEEAQKKEKIKQEQQRKKEKLFRATGDAAVNLYADAVVRDIKSKLNLSYPVAIYGGSTYSEYFLLNEREMLKFPIILVAPNSRFTFINKEYLNINVNGVYVSHTYSLNALPIDLGFDIHIASENEKQTTEIKSCLNNMYAAVTLITVPDPVISGEMCSIRMQIGEREKQRENQLMWLSVKPKYAKYRVTISSKWFPSVYYPTKYTRADIEDNLILQQKILQQIEFFMLCDSYLRNRGIYQLNNYYKNLFVPTKKGFFASLLNPLDELQKSDDYQKLKSDIQKGSVDKALFDKVLIGITEEYPPLYDRMLQGWSLEQIQADMLKFADHFNREWNALLKNLANIACPKIYTQLNLSLSSLDPSLETIHTGVVYYLDKMIWAFCFHNTLENVVSQYAEELEKQREQERKNQERERQLRKQRLIEQRERAYSNEVFLKGVDLGTALGNKLPQPKQRSDGKVDLWGTAACPYGMKAKMYDSSAPDFMTIRCNISCPKWGQCSHR